MASNDNAAQDGSRFQLYGCWRSTCTHRAILALRFHGVDCDYHPINLTTREQESPEFLAISPDAQVPVLVFGDNIGWKIEGTDIDFKSFALVRARSEHASAARAGACATM